MANYFINNYDFDGVFAVACLAGHCRTIHEISANDGGGCIDRVFAYGVDFYSSVRRVDWQT